jgi:hypothetical protein
MFPCGGKGERRKVVKQKDGEMATLLTPFHQLLLLFACTATFAPRGDDWIGWEMLELDVVDDFAGTSSPSAPPIWLGELLRSNTEVAHHRRLLERYVENGLPAYSPGAHSGRGIVICAGGRNGYYFQQAYVMVRLLRHHGVDLPVEYFFNTDADMPPLARRLLEPLGVKLVNASQNLAHRLPELGVVFHGHGSRDLVDLSGWNIKPWAMLLSHFEEFIYFDVDNLPLRDPTFLFDSSGYVRTGALVWPDLCSSNSTQREAYAAFGVESSMPDPIGYERRRAAPAEGAAPGDCDILEVEWFMAEAVFDKRRVWRALLLTAFANLHHNFFDKWMYGDKELYHLAFLATATPFAIVDSLPGAIGRMVVEPFPHSPQRNRSPLREAGPRRIFCGAGTTHGTPTTDGGELFLLHRMHDKLNIFKHLAKNGMESLLRHVVHVPVGTTAASRSRRTRALAALSRATNLRHLSSVRAFEYSLDGPSHWSFIHRLQPRTAIEKEISQKFNPTQQIGCLSPSPADVVFENRVHPRVAGLEELLINFLVEVLPVFVQARRAV